MPARRLGADHLDVGLHRLQKTRQPHERSRRAEGTDQIVDLAARLLPDFERRRLIVRQVVAGVGELIGHEIAVGRRRYGRTRITDRPVGTLLGGSENHLGAVGADDLAPFDRHGLRHDDLHGIPLDDSHDRQADARIARRGFDDGFARREPPFALGLLDHLDRNAVLDAARRVEAFELGENIDLPVGGKVVQAHHRRRTDRSQDIVVNHNAGVLFYPDKVTIFPDAMRSRGEKYEIIRTFTAGARQRIGASAGGRRAHPQPRQRIAPLKQARPIFNRKTRVCASTSDFPRLGCAEDTYVRQCSNKFDIVLAYSYLWLRLRYCGSEKEKRSFFLFLSP